MTHEHAAPLLGDFLHGRLGSTVGQQVSTHVQTCAECVALAECYLVLSDGLNDPTGGTGETHPPSETIVRYALGHELVEDQRNWVASHTLTCSLCSEEIEATTEAESEVAGLDTFRDESRGAAAERRRLPTAVWAAVVMMAVLAYPAYRIHQRLLTLESGGASAAAASVSRAPVASLFLESPIRSDASAVDHATIADGQTVVPVGVFLPPMEEFSGFDKVDFTVRDARDQPVWSSSLSRAELDAAVEDGMVYFLIGTDVLPDGSYALTVSREAETTETVFVARFGIERAPESRAR